MALLGISVIRLWIVTSRAGHFTSLSGGFAGDIVIDRITLGSAVLGLLLFALSFLGRRSGA